MQKTVLGQTEFSISDLVSRETVTAIFDSSKDFAADIESQNIPYVVWQDNKQDNYYMLIPTTGGVCKVEFELADAEGVSGYQYYLGFADGLSNTSFGHYKGTQRFFSKEVDCYLRREVEKAA